MPQEIQVGRATLYGIQSTGSGDDPFGMSGSSAEATGYASFTWDTAKLVHKVTIHDIKDEGDADVSAAAANDHFELDIKWTPSAKTRADVASKTIILPTFSKVVFTSFKNTFFNGTYQYRGDQTIDLAKAHGSMTLKLRRYLNDAQNTALTTVVQEA